MTVALEQTKLREKFFIFKEVKMGTAIDYQKVMTEIVHINLPGPSEPTPGMTGGELLHGFLADLKQSADPNVKEFVEYLCNRWNVNYRNNGE